MFAHSRDPHLAIKLWCQVPFSKSKTIFQIIMYCMQWFFKSKYIKSRIFNDKNRLINKKIMGLQKLLPHLATRGPFSPGDWRFDEAWREQTLLYPPVMCQQRLIYCTWELNVMMNWIKVGLSIGLLPVQHQAIPRSNSDWLSVELLRHTFQWNFNSSAMIWKCCVLNDGHLASTLIWFSLLGDVWMMKMK